MSNLPALAPIPRRKKFDRGARGPANPRRILTTVKVQAFDPVNCEIVTETTQAYIRALPPVLAAMPEPLRRAAQIYAKAFEEANAGGAVDPAMFGGGSGGSTREGRQFHALRHVSHLRQLESVVGTGMVDLGHRRDGSPVSIARLEILRAVAVDGLTVAGLLAGLRLGRSVPRRKAVTAALLVSVTTLALCLGLIDGHKKTTLS